MKKGFYLIIFKADDTPAAYAPYGPVDTHQQAVEAVSNLLVQYKPHGATYGLIYAAHVKIEIQTPTVATPVNPFRVGGEGLPAQKA